MTTMKRKEVLESLKEKGFYSVRKSSHEIFRNAQGLSVAVPYHRLIAPGTLRDIFKAIGKNSIEK